MGEKETIFSSSIKYKGIFDFSDLYQFCYDWLTEEADLDVEEGKYVEKIKGNEKEVGGRSTPRNREGIPVRGVGKPSR